MKDKKYNLGLVSVSFRNKSPKEILEAMQKVGLTHIEWGSDIHAPYQDNERLQEISDLQKEYRITCSSYGTYFRLGMTPIDELEGYIAAASILGTNILRLWCGTKNAAEMTPNEREVLMEDCRKAAKLAEEQNVTLCMECHKDTFTENPEDAVALMKEINSPNFRMYWQPFQWQSAFQNIENAEKIAPYAVHLHIFNWKDDKRFPLCEAVEEWRSYLNQFTTPRTLLLEFMPNDDIDELEKEFNALKTISEVDNI